MAQFLVLDVKLKGAVIDGPMIKAMPENQFDIEKGQLKGWIVTYMGDEGWQDAIFVMAEKGWYEQTDEIGVRFRAYQTSGTKSDTKYVEKGILSVDFHIELEDLRFEGITLGKYIHTETEVDEKLFFVTKGAGEVDTEFDGYINNAKIKVNAKLTAGINGEEVDPEEFMEAFIATKVRDEVNLDFGIFY